MEVLNKSFFLISSIPARCEHGVLRNSNILSTSILANNRSTACREKWCRLRRFMRNEAELRQIVCIRRRLQRPPLTNRGGRWGLAALARSHAARRNQYRYRRLRGRYRLDSIMHSIYNTTMYIVRKGNRKGHHGVEARRTITSGDILEPQEKLLQEWWYPNFREECSPT